MQTEAEARCPQLCTQALRTNSTLIELNLSRVRLSSDGIIALAEAQGQVVQAFPKASAERKSRVAASKPRHRVQAIKENRTFKELSLAGATIGEEGTFALLEAGSYCTCSRFTATPKTFS